jgi:hypothetical protein
MVLFINDVIFYKIIMKPILCSVFIKIACAEERIFKNYPFDFFCSSERILLTTIVG